MHVFDVYVYTCTCNMMYMYTYIYIYTYLFFSNSRMDKSPPRCGKLRAEFGPAGGLDEQHGVG